jgi:hypothetical protein
LEHMYNTSLFRMGCINLFRDVFLQRSAPHQDGPRVPGQGPLDFIDPFGPKALKIIRVSRWNFTWKFTMRPMASRPLK